MQLQPLSNRPELYVNGNIDGIIYSSSNVPVLLSSKSKSGPQGELSITYGDISKAAKNELHYAGSSDSGMFFYVKKRGMFLEQNYLLILLINLDAKIQHHVIRETEFPSVKFFHRQPYYLLRSVHTCISKTNSFRKGLLGSPWMVFSFSSIKCLNELNLSGISMEDAILIFKQEKVVIFRYGQRYAREATDKNVIVVEHPDLDSKCTAFSNDNAIYVALSTKPQIWIFDTTTLAVEKLQLSAILDLRYVAQTNNSCDLIFAEVTKNGRELRVMRLEDRYSMSRWQLDCKNTRLSCDLRNAKAEASTAVEKLKQVKKEYEELKKGKDAHTKALELECGRLATATDQNGKMKGEISSLKQQLNNEKQKAENLRRNVQKLNSDKQNALVKEQENQREMLKMKKESFAIAAQRRASENELASTRHERDFLAAQKADLERKYRQVLLQMGRSSLASDAHSRLDDQLPGTTNSSNEMGKAQEKSNDTLHLNVKKPNKKRRKNQALNALAS